MKHLHISSNMCCLQTASASQIPRDLFYSWKGKANRLQSPNFAWDMENLKAYVLNIGESLCGLKKHLRLALQRIVLLRCLCSWFPYKQCKAEHKCDYLCDLSISKFLSQCSPRLCFGAGGTKLPSCVLSLQAWPLPGAMMLHWLSGHTHLGNEETLKLGVPVCHVR